MTPPAPNSTDEIRLLGRAIEVLRTRSGLTQAEAAGRLGIQPQAWQRYEAGARQNVLRTDLQDRIARALGFDRPALLNERARLAGETPANNVLQFPDRERSSYEIPVIGRRLAASPVTPAEPTRFVDLRALLGPTTDALEVAGDAMHPWADPGEVVVFDRDRYPKRGAGCVIETLEGEYFVRIYERSDGSSLFVRELYPEEKVVALALKDLKGVYAVRFRGD